MRARVVLALGMMLIGLPIGIAIAGGPASAPTGGVDPERVEFVGGGTNSPPHTVTLPEGEELDLDPPLPGPPKTPENPPPSVNVIGNAVPERLLQECRTEPGSRGDCDLVLAIGAGKIKPGRYTDGELNRKLEAEGYEGGF